MDKRITVEHRRAIKSIRRATKAKDGSMIGLIWHGEDINASKAVREVKRYR